MRVSEQGHSIMETKFFKTLLAIAILLSAQGYHTSASAEIQAETLGSDASAVDRYRVTCSTLEGAATVRLATQVINNTASSPLLSVQVYKASKATNSTDNAGGDLTYSPLAYVNGGDGIYYIAVDKAGTGAVDYSLFYQCETGQGAATGTAISIRQDQ